MRLRQQDQPVVRGSVSEIGSRDGGVRHFTCQRGDVNGLSIHVRESVSGATCHVVERWIQTGLLESTGSVDVDIETLRERVLESAR